MVKAVSRRITNSLRTLYVSSLAKHSIYDKDINCILTVHDDGNFLSMLGSQDVVQKGRLARSKVA